MKLCYTGRAATELNIAFSWYEGQRKGLGFEFLDCVEAVVKTILQTPKLYAKYHHPFRRALVQRFPFSVFYTIEINEIVVHAIFDNRQDPARIP